MRRQSRQHSYPLLQYGWQFTPGVVIDLFFVANEK